MGDIEEDRIYADTLGKTDLYVATGLGVAAVSVSNDRIGQFSLAHRCEAHDVAADGTRVLVATDEDVLAIETGGPDLPVEPLDFGPAVAVGVADAPLAAAPDGTVYALTDDWEPLGTVASVRAIDGDLVASFEGVFRVDETLEHVGLDDAFDVVGRETPYAATSEGLYRLGPGWTRDLEGDFRVVSAAGEQAHAATADALYTREGGSWRERDVPTDEPIVDVGYVKDGGVVGITKSGTCLVDPVAAKDGASGWRSRSLGLPETAALAVPEQ
ncbi:HVO_0234 family beta-propeller protein [Halapricum salinum]|uniref:HVO-0234-like beta-propeller domain-containing protein n=1 Tax=Halapricum salinum TaxID=1457250 RepID=A0A4D6HBA2_9EURY|nr:hypothetical protein [Halapricum salinum]QCC50925.1 hypothetical protein DV733_06550 [Halapricum salinum]